MKLSFSIPSSKSSRPAAAAKPAINFDEDSGRGAESTKSQFVTDFDPSQPLADGGHAKHVIPPIPNNSFHLRPSKKMKNLIPNAEEDPTAMNSETRFVLDSSNSDPAASAIPYGLTVRSSSAAQEQENGEISQRDPPEDLMLRRYKEDMNLLPDDRGFDEFKDIAVEDFAAAMLAGYGWKEGQGIGKTKKEDVKVIQYDRRAGTEGLGYAPDPTVAKVKKDRYSRLQSKEEKRQVEPENEKIVRIVSGRHAGFKGKVLERLKNGIVVLKVIYNGEEIRVANDEIAEMGSVEEEKCLRKLKELEIHERDEKRERHKEEKSSREKHREDRRDKENTKEGSRREEMRGRDGDNKQDRVAHHKSNARPDWTETGTVRWLTSHIRVRIISKDFKGGRLYLKKGKVVDVVSPTKCDISMDESGELLQSVDQEILETALPKRGGSVLILYGKHKGVYGSLVEKDTEEETGVVKDADTHMLINVRLEQIAEYIGDPTYISY